MSMPSDHDDTNPDIPRKRRKLDQPESSSSTNTALTELRWRTPAEQHSYSTKLIDALCHIRRRGHGQSTGRTVRYAADRVLAASARGKTRWSRAVLTRRLAHPGKKHKKAVVAKPARNKPAVRKKKLHHPLQKKVKVLGRLVPGCRKLSLPNLLEETSDYVKALEMQVKAMAFLTGLLNAGRGGGGGDYSTS